MCPRFTTARITIATNKKAPLKTGVHSQPEALFVGCVPQPLSKVPETPTNRSSGVQSGALNPPEAGNIFCHAESTTFRAGRNEGMGTPVFSWY